MADFLPFVLTTGQVVYLNMGHVVSVRYNGGFYLVTTSELVSTANPASPKAQSLANRVYEVREIPFPLE